MKRVYTVAIIIAVSCSLIGGGLVYKKHVSDVAQAAAQQRTAAALKAKQQAAAAKLAAETAAAAAAVAFNKQQYSADAPDSIWVVANKQRPLQPKDYAPTDLVVPQIPLRLGKNSSEMQLRQAAATALESMTTAAEKAGVHLMLASAYRSYNLQVSVYGNEVKNYGQATADSESARPGYSEHQTGLAADLEPVSHQCEIADCFVTTPEGKWLVAHAGEFGFMQRYTIDKTAVTGYRAEAWHFRYVGIGLTTELQKQGSTTLEEFFGLPAAPSY
ncbi:MAG: M15 family metallopeptidase [Patescibacteria group bacterium]|nr:M15 family metallopeptidase [Patescibacteria group bacterium]